MTRHQTPSRPRAIALLAGVALLASLVAAPVAVANGVTTRYVGPGGGTGGCLTPTYGTIADAVSAASTGGTIHTCADTYNLTAPVTIGQALLTFEGDGAATTMVDGGSAHGLFASSGDAMALSFSGLTLRNARYGHVAGDFGGAIDADAATSPSRTASSPSRPLPRTPAPARSSATGTT